MAIQLTCILEHPTQWDPPLWAALIRRGNVNPTVWYLRPETPIDLEIGQKVSWQADYAVKEFKPGQLECPASALRVIGQRAGDIDALLIPGWTRPISWYCMIAAYARRIPILLPTDKVFEERSKTPRHTLSALFDRVKRHLFNGFVTTGSLARDELLRHRVVPEQIARALYVVDTRKWREDIAGSRSESGHIREAIGVAPNDLVFVTVCKLSTRESPLDVVDGFAAYLQRDGTSGHLLMVGDGPLRHEIEERIRRLGIAKYVSLVGYVPYSKLSSYYGASDVFIHMPLTEPWGISVLEAVACGLPVVATENVGAAVDIVHEGQTGALCADRDPQTIADALGRAAGLLSDRTRLIRELSASITPFDVESASEELEKLLMRVTRRSLRFAHGPL